MGPRAGLDGCGKSHTHRDSIPGPSSQQRVVIPTELSWPTACLYVRKKLAASSMLHEAKIAYYAFDVIVYCMCTHQTRIAYKKRTH